MGSALQQTTATAPDEAFPIICATLAAAAAPDVELRAVEDFGAVGMAIFARIVAGDERGASGLFGAEALADYSAFTGLSVEASQVQGLVEKLIAANLATRLEHGVYAVADPFVGGIFMDKHKLGLDR